MGRGDRATSSSPSNALRKINEMRSKWGLGGVSDNHSSGSRINASTARNMYSWLNQGKSKSGWGGSVPTSINVSPNTVITDIFPEIINTAEKIKSHCPCNCNYCKCNCNHCRCYCNECGCNDGRDT